MKAVIISGGKAPSLNLIKKQISKDTVIICADSGADCLYEYDITPHYIIGDLDSINKKCLEFFKSKKQVKFDVYPSHKDFTDTYLALKKAMELRCSEITFLGCTGTRMDHFLGNLGLLKNCLDNNIKSSMLDDNNKIFITDSNMTIDGKKGSYFSLQAFWGEVSSLSIKGCKYELHNYNLFPGDSLTVSNEFEDSRVYVSFSSGILLVMLCND